MNERNERERERDEREKGGGFNVGTKEDFGTSSHYVRIREKNFVGRRRLSECFQEGFLARDKTFDSPELIFGLFLTAQYNESSSSRLIIWPWTSVEFRNQFEENFPAGNANERG